MATARRDERRRYVRRNLWRYVPGFVVFFDVALWLLGRDPLSAASLEKAVKVTILTIVIGVPWAAHRLGKLWDKKHGGNRGS